MLYLIFILFYYLLHQFKLNFFLSIHLSFISTEPHFPLSFISLSFFFSPFYSSHFLSFSFTPNEHSLRDCLFFFFCFFLETCFFFSILVNFEFLWQPFHMMKLPQTYVKNLSLGKGKQWFFSLDFYWKVSQENIYFSFFGSKSVKG